MTETRTDVFDEAASFIETYVKNGQSYADSIRARYAAAPAEVVKVPAGVKDEIAYCKNCGSSLVSFMGYVAEGDMEEPVIDWINDNPGAAARAFMAWPSVEVEK